MNIVILVGVLCLLQAVSSHPQKYELKIHVPSNPRCKTIPSWQSSGTGNPDPGKKCILPFIWAGEEQYDCIYDTRGAWCATEVDGRGNYIDKKWGVCEPECNVSDTWESVCRPLGSTFTCTLEERAP